MNRMRPVYKGEKPYESIKTYKEVESYLEERIGPYCSFCELHINHVPEVEHREAKSTGGELAEWNNLLLSCKYCNTRKGVKVKKGEKDKYLWPDEDDTFHAYSYNQGIAQINEEYLDDQDALYAERAKSLFELVGLGNIPSPKGKDRRFMERNEAYNCALSSKDGWANMKDEDDRKKYLEMIILLAKQSGFFSTWMEVFKDNEILKKEFIKAFKGTKQSVFDKE